MKILANELPIQHWLRVAARNGINARTFHRRLKQHPPNVAATLPLANKGPSPTPGSIFLLARQAGVNYHTVQKRRKRGLPLSECLSQRLSYPPGSHPDSINAKAKAAGINPSTVRSRLFYGWTLEKALQTPTAKTKKRKR